MVAMKQKIVIMWLVPAAGMCSKGGDGKDVIGAGAEPQGEALVSLVSFSSPKGGFFLKNSYTFLVICRAKNLWMFIYNYLHFMINTMA